MPHLHIEYTDNLTGLNERELMREVNAVVCNHPTVTDEADVKSRIARLNMGNVYIGNQPDNRGFVHVQLQLMAGRSTEAKKQMSDGIAEVLRRLVPQPADLHVQLSVDVADMDKATYFKGRL
ncbi:5-carboxymethyl-2-hydroxymuconate Delta-isomerase [Comamonas suwonensis]|uniref:5-carboxymethyl-2-hydroxymuconate Delta-isomerase n=1 Tax=Comamonas suwonensis TaxID=2606214 RepID=UPI00145C82B5|nr:5-carboxymethyl-2-hydroxymuconate Delta-isomerase [Comamonas suwonensis]MBI1625264.1 5-carboxymethyl-2-hydroxymuconate Delta-isomerase [Comamonas suwonensis]